MNDDIDREVARTLQMMPTPEHRPGFWDDLESQLARDDYTSPGDSPSAPRQRLSWAVASAAAVLVIVAVVVIGARVTNDDGPSPVATQPTVPSSVALPTPSTSSLPESAPTAEETAAIDTAKRFVAAVAAGDDQQAASLLGPRSEESLVATSGSVEAYLRDNRDDLRTWGQLMDRHIEAFTVRPGDVVVVFEGAAPTTTESLPAAFAIPARHAESANVWFVEPWASDLKAGGGIGLQSPDPAAPVPQLPPGATVEVSLPEAGQVWFGLDRDPLTPVSIESAGSGLVARWTPTNLSPGPHTLVVVFQNSSQTTYSALSRIVEAT